MPPPPRPCPLSLAGLPQAFVRPRIRPLPPRCPRNGSGYPAVNPPDLSVNTRHEALESSKFHSAFRRKADSETVLSRDILTTTSWSHGGIVTVPYLLGHLECEDDSAFVIGDAYGHIVTQRTGELTEVRPLVYNLMNLVHHFITTLCLGIIPDAVTVGRDSWTPG
ncbi:hypothetical protein BKA93DRAFT_881444 [Sparassis latifolia]